MLVESGVGRNASTSKDIVEKVEEVTRVTINEEGECTLLVNDSNVPIV